MYIFHIISASPLSPETTDCKSKTKSAMEHLFGDVVAVKVEEAKPISARACYMLQISARASAMGKSLNLVEGK